MNGAMSCIRHACANLILVKDDERGAGHITAVAGMHLGTPQIVSSVEVLSDYFINHYNCIKVPVGADAATRHAVEKLLQYSSLTQQLVANGRNYAAKWLTHEAATQRMFRAIDRVFREEKTQEADPEWLAFMGSFSEIHSDGRESASESI
jgi:glycosyltransferase involved in cell wall biosynthesis